jgi:hypothetical protein
MPNAAARLPVRGRVQGHPLRGVVAPSPSSRAAPRMPIAITARSPCWMPGTITIATYLSDVVIEGPHDQRQRAQRHRGVTPRLPFPLRPGRCVGAAAARPPPPASSRASQGWRLHSNDHGGCLSQAFLRPPAQGTKRPAPCNRFGHVETLFGVVAGPVAPRRDPGHPRDFPLQPGKSGDRHDKRRGIALISRTSALQMYNEHSFVSSVVSDCEAIVASFEAEKMKIYYHNIIIRRRKK